MNSPRPNGYAGQNGYAPPMGQPAPMGQPDPNAYGGPNGYGDQNGLPGPGRGPGPFGFAGQDGFAGQSGFAGQNGGQEPNGFAGPGGHGFTGQPGYQGPTGFEGSAGRPGAAGWPGPAQPAPGAFAVPGESPGQNPYGGGNGYPGQPERAAGAGFAGQNEHPASNGYGHPGPDGHDRNINGGGYAQVIREEDTAGGRPGERAGGDGRAQPDRSTAALRAITAASAGSDSAAEAAADPDFAYGPDDPGYGPPGPDWYLRDQEEPVVTEAATIHVVADVADVTPAAVPIRSPFEPLPRTNTGSWPTEPGPAGAGETGDGDASDSHTAAEQANFELASYLSAGYEGPDAGDSNLIEFGAGDEALGQFRTLYASAERLGAEPIGLGGADEQFGQLLERQRKLISEYFKESGALTDATAEITAHTSIRTEDWV
jgi:hypothetical protein